MFNYKTLDYKHLRQDFGITDDLRGIRVLGGCVTVSAKLRGCAMGSAARLASAKARAKKSLNVEDILSEAGLRVRMI